MISYKPKRKSIQKTCGISCRFSGLVNGLLVELKTALWDARSVFQGEAVIVNEERLEAWENVLSRAIMAIELLNLEKEN